MISIESFPGTHIQEKSEDCRTLGCAVGECIRQGTQFVCQQGKYTYLPFFPIYLLLSNDFYKYVKHKLLNYTPYPPKL